MDWFYHDSHNLFYRNPFGAVPCGQALLLRANVAATTPETGDNGLEPGSETAIRSIALRAIFERSGKEKVEELKLLPGKNELSGGTEDPGWFALPDQDQSGLFPGGSIFHVEFYAPELPGLLWYYFVIQREDGTYYYGNNREQTGGPGQLTREIPPAFQVTVHAPGLTTPSWFRGAVVYQIFVERFHNGHGNTILSPKKNSLVHAHWNNDPVYIRDVKTGHVIRWDFFGGNLEGVRQKLTYLKSLGIRAIYFNPIFEAPSNHKYDTGDYHKIDPMYGTEELFATLCDEGRRLGIHVILDGVFSHTGSDSIYFNREGNYKSLGAYQSVHSPYFSWYRFSEYPDEYDSWWGIETMPNVEELEPSYQDFIIFDQDSVTRQWQRKGAKGWRLDVVDELPDAFVKNLRRVMKELDPDSILIGEVWEDASNKISYSERREYLLGEELDSTMNYPFRRILLDFFLGKKDAQEAHMALMSLYENYPREHFYNALNLAGSHDVARIRTELGRGLPASLDLHHKEDILLQRQQLFSLLQFTFPGVPCIYYGDEAGLEGGKDPENRKTYPWGEENQELVEWYKTISALRNHYDVLQTGAWQLLHAEGPVYGFMRIIENGWDIFGQPKKDNTAVVLFNRDMEQSAALSLDLSPWCEGNLVDVLADYKAFPLQEGRLELSLKPLEGRLLLQDRWSSNYQEFRESGVLLHPTSLPSPFGIGDMGDEAFDFVDFLQDSGQKLWQILPLNPPGIGFSPYQCFSAFAGNHMLIDPRKLAHDGLLDELHLECPVFPKDRVDFPAVETFKAGLFSRAYTRFQERGGPQRADYRDFCRENACWLEDYALFMALKSYFNGVAWDQWEHGAAFRDPETLERYRQELDGVIAYHKFLQFIFFQQWAAVKDYAQEKGIRIVGDLPIFVAHDSSDVWSHPELFQLDEKGAPQKVAGVPPDYFSETGQLWGNPHYRWDSMAEDGYRWWKDRFALLSRLVDVIRIDHFRGFEAYWEIPAGEETAINGRWVQGPGEPFFREVMEELEPVEFIAEDLGYITPEVEDLKTRLGFPGMLIMQFALKGKPGEKLEFPLHKKNTVLYTGTHDNDTMLGWYRRYVEPEIDPEKKAADQPEVSWHYIEMAMHSDACKVIFPMQDLLGLGTEARMNIPGTAEGNWDWRLSPDQWDPSLAGRLYALTKKYHRQDK